MVSYLLTSPWRQRRDAIRPPCERVTRPIFWTAERPIFEERHDAFPPHNLAVLLERGVPARGVALLAGEDVPVAECPAGLAGDDVIEGRRPELVPLRSAVVATVDVLLARDPPRDPMCITGAWRHAR